MNYLKSLTLLIAIMALVYSCNRPGNNYYIDSLKGNDSNDGLSPGKAWQTLEKASQGTYQAGDKILLKGGQIFNGSLVLESISGSAGLPIVISSYGEGRAIISSGDSVAVSVSHSNFIDIKDLICRGSGRLYGNYASGLDLTLNSNLNVDNIDVAGYLQSGITVRGGSDIRITNVYAHENGYAGIHVFGIREVRDQQESAPWLMPSQSATTSTDIGKAGKQQETRVRNVYIGYSVAENNPGSPAVTNNHSGNGILIGRVNNGLIEYCEAFNNGWDMPREGNGPVGIWAHDSDSIIIQYCFSHNNKTSERGVDGGGFDFDGGMTNSIMQYNMSAFNEGAGYGIYQYREAGVWDNNIVRYNISYHDGIKNSQCGIHVWIDYKAANQMSNFHAYNNTVINKYGYGVNFTPGHYENFIFENNIFVVKDRADEFIGGNFTGASFDRNVFYNTYHSREGLPQPALRLDENPLVSDPLLLIPPDGAFSEYNATNINSFPFFKLQSGSPASRSGNRIVDNGGRDYWGNILPAEGRPNIGAYGK